jgi:hypothetical protein
MKFSKDKPLGAGSSKFFDLIGYAKAKRAYAWQCENGLETKGVAVLEIPPVDSPEIAVKVAIAAKGRVRAKV